MRRSAGSISTSVRQVSRDFVAGVQTNLRMRVFADPLSLLRSIVSRAYTRTVRLGELFESAIFAKVWKDAPPEAEARPPASPASSKNPSDGCRRGFPAEGPQLAPPGQGASIDPERHDFEHGARLAVTPASWASRLGRFTTKSMGRTGFGGYITKTHQKRTKRSRSAKRWSRRPAFPASSNRSGSTASTASRKKARRQKRLVVRHVDGGVHDNQGIASLFEQGCSVVLVSDASGQTALATDAGGGALVPLMRSNTVLMQRVRQEQYARLDAMQLGGLLKGAMFIHLKQDLDVVPVDWIGCEEQPEETSTQENEPLTKYGMRKKIQELLAGIRTDLDSFSDVEAFSLMTSGYRMAGYYLQNVEVLPTPSYRSEDWDFLEIERVLQGANTNDPSYGRLLRLLRSGGSRMFGSGRSRAFCYLLRRYLGSLASYWPVLGSPA